MLVRALLLQVLDSCQGSVLLISAIEKGASTAFGSSTFLEENAFNTASNIPQIACIIFMLFFLVFYIGRGGRN